MKFFIKCDDSQILCDKAQYNSATFAEKLIHIFHLAFCAICRKYTIRNIKLTKLIKKSKIKTLPVEVKNSLKEKLQSQLNQ